MYERNLQADPVPTCTAQSDGLVELKPGVKLDSGKVPVHRGLFNYFPRALLEVARVSQRGVETSGYPWGGWRDVPNALERYTDARARHLLGESIQMTDPKTGCLEAAHVAWNALAVLELHLQKIEAERFAEPTLGPTENGNETGHRASGVV